VSTLSVLDWDDESMKIEIELTLCYRSRLFIPKILVAFVRAPPPQVGGAMRADAPPSAQVPPPRQKGGARLKWVELGAHHRT
jgi:hypothetical protein